MIIHTVPRASYNKVSNNHKVCILCTSDGTYVCMYVQWNLCLMVCVCVCVCVCVMCVCILFVCVEFRVSVFPPILASVSYAQAVFSIHVQYCRDLVKLSFFVYVQCELIQWSLFNLCGHHWVRLKCPE